MSEVERTDGRVLADRYRLVEVLGKGGMGTVWRAVDETLGRTVAVKELRFPGNVDEDEKRRLVTRTLREAKATARIRNTGAITVFDVVKEDDRPWIVMELIEGRSLSDAIREDGPLTPRRAAEVGLVLLDVLRAAHAEGILHRDVKPSNVLIAYADAGAAPGPSGTGPGSGSGPGGSGSSGGGRVVLGDFGIAQIDGDPSVTSTGMLVGAPSYISPERARGQKPGPPADLWSLGALLYACVEGRPPYDKGSAIATLTAVMTEPVGPMRGAGPLAAAITGLLEKDPAKRLDEPAARAMLAAVANAPDRPAAPPPPAPDGARTAVLPVDPQPAPTDAPPAARRAAAEQARLRGALGSVRKAAARPGGESGPAAGRVPGPGTSGTPAASRTPGADSPAGPGSRPGANPGSGSGSRPRPAVRPRPAPEPGTPENVRPPAPASITDVVPRRTLVIIVAALVIALLGTVIGVAIANSGGGRGSGGPDGGGNGSTPSASSAPGSHKAKGATAGATAGGGSAPATTASGKPAGDTAGPPPGKGPGPGGKALPAGWHMYTDPEGFSIALPAGWRRTGDNGYGSGSKFSGPGDRELLVDVTHQPGKSALADWRNQEARLAPGWSDYHRVQLRDVAYRTYDAADWEYKYRSAGRPVHVLDRGFVTDRSHGYAIMFTTAAAEWNSAENRLARQTFFATFKPA